MLIYEFSTPVETVLNLASFTKIGAYFSILLLCTVFVLHNRMGVMCSAEMNHKQLVIFRWNKVRNNVKHSACVLFCSDHLSLSSIWEVQQLPSLPLLGLAFGS